MDPRRPHLILCQVSDSQRYIHTMTKMNVFSFIEVIIPNTFVEGSSLSKLYIDIRERFPAVTVTSVQRRHFNETTGVDLINQYGSPESASVMVLLRDKFYALSAASALIKYVEFTQNILFAPRSMKVEYQGTEDTMIIDLETANKLELVVNCLKSQSTTDNSLYGVLKHCHTKGGLRLLRANILQPMCSVKRIESRLDCVTELVKKPLLFFAIESAVTSFSNIENLLSLCMHEPQQDGLRAAEYQLKYVLLLKTILEQLPTLVTSLEEATSDYFCEVRENLGDVRYGIILNRILESVPENAKSVKGSVSAHLHACFAVKTGINALLDVAKKTYCEIVQEIWDHVNSLREQFGVPLRMSFSAHRGFHIQYTPGPGDKNFNPQNDWKKFSLIQKSKSTFYFYTPELVALDQRSQQVLNEVKLISNVIFFELLNDIREHIGCLFNLCEYIAELDVITSFAHISSGQNYVRPKFGDVLNVTESRHPILDVIHDGKVVPNDIFAEKGRNCVILTGPNQSGKSVYICQVALLQVMAQIGCYVPASSATFRITDRLFSRLGFDDSMETNASTLIAEMRDIEFLRQNITANSLLIIDELCKGTSVDEGTSLAFTICEEFLDSTAFIFLTTHYIFLTKLEEMYFNVTNYYFESELVESGGKKTLKFSHKKSRGVTKAEQYGLQIAESTCFPGDVLSKAKEISQQLLLERKVISSDQLRYGF
ncbi:UNVERIFIED_CONTAM: hypothetical protein PYX00_003220 [Menopon gallinae]|uniref:DNA mismatch repair proteins mutS family domain-containing protein n=1 Tax=Menopon gallinae TaxID=328185 RepID=A0AAW2I0G6_9NEOP